MKIVYIVKSKMHFYPPCVSQIRMIKKLGYEIEVLYSTCDSTTLEILSKENIQCIKVSNIKDDYKGKLRKAYGWVKFRVDLSRYIKKYKNEDVVYWFGNAESVIPMKFKLKNKKYVVSLLELFDNFPFKREMLHGIIENAYKVTCCEETRAYIIQYWYSLKSLPTVFPNKSYEQITQRCVEPTSDITRQIINEIKNDRVIIYQGYIWNTEELVEIAKALNAINLDYKFVLMGIDLYNSFDKIKDIYKNTVFYPYIPAPLHLEITSYARIGVLFYRPTALNNAFCAPNKIFEYGGFGIPMLGNDIPGLKNTVGCSKAGQFVEFKKDKIIKAILEIENNYQSYSENAKKYYESINNLETMKEFLKSLIVFANE